MDLLQRTPVDVHSANIPLFSVFKRRFSNLPNSILYYETNGGMQIRKAIRETNPSLNVLLTIQGERVT
jgi:hypothetical protein